MIFGTVRILIIFTVGIISCWFGIEVQISTHVSGCAVVDFVSLSSTLEGKLEATDNFCWCETHLLWDVFDSFLFSIDMLNVSTRDQTNVVSWYSWVLETGMKKVPARQIWSFEETLVLCSAWAREKSSRIGTQELLFICFWQLSSDPWPFFIFIVIHGIDDVFSLCFSFFFHPGVHVSTPSDKVIGYYLGWSHFILHLGSVSRSRQGHVCRSPKHVRRSAKYLSFLRFPERKTASSRLIYFDWSLSHKLVEASWCSGHSSSLDACGMHVCMRERRV